MEPIVDVNIAVYNQAPFLRQTLDSVLEQVTNFTFRLLIGDDCSTDGSINILKEYEAKHPGKVKVIYQEKNLGFHSKERNGTILFKNSTAKYISLLDGDDYWVDKNKLQKQVDFLEKNLDYSICFHSIYELSGKKGLKPSPFYKCKEEKTYTIEELAKGNFISTASVVYRNGLINIPDWFNEVIIGDYILHMLHAQYGKIMYFPDLMTVYRIHNGSVYGGKRPKYQCESMLKALDKLIGYFQNFDQVAENIKWQSAFLKSQLADIYLEENNKEKYLELLKESFLQSPKFMDEWLLDSKSNVNMILRSTEYKIGWALKNPLFMIKKYALPQKAKK